MSFAFRFLQMERTFQHSRAVDREKGGTGLRSTGDGELHPPGPPALHACTGALALHRLVPTWRAGWCLDHLETRKEASTSPHHDETRLADIMTSIGQTGPN
jgi:hypothetical protein